MIAEHELIVLTRDVPAKGLVAGDVGTVVNVYPDDRAYEVEFMTVSGDTVDVITLEPDQVRPVRNSNISHAREANVAAA